ncbi:MAG: hypothetical protein HOP31_08775 [Ignavibacteria bacterium]|nr:hypothetical protein [Ignavibacteria bacterium]
MKSLKLSLIISVLFLSFPGLIQSQEQTNSLTQAGDTCHCITDQQIQGFEIARVELNAFKAAYYKEKETRLQDKSNYNYTITRLEKSILEIQEALKLEQAMPKVIIKANPDWYWFAAGGSAITVISYFIYKLFIKK